MAWGGFSGTVWKMQLFLHYIIDVCSNLSHAHMQSKTHHACSHAKKNFMKVKVLKLKRGYNNTPVKVLLVWLPPALPPQVVGNDVIIHVPSYILVVCRLKAELSSIGKIKAPEFCNTNKKS